MKNHTDHCLKRQLWGDGECECGHDESTAKTLAEARQLLETCHQFAVVDGRNALRDGLAAFLARTGGGK